MPIMPLLRYSFPLYNSIRRIGTTLNYACGSFFLGGMVYILGRALYSINRLWKVQEASRQSKQMIETLEALDSVLAAQLEKMDPQSEAERTKQQELQFLHHKCTTGLAQLRDTDRKLDNELNKMTT